MSVQEPNDTTNLKLTSNHIDLLCQICDKAWEKYFSKPLPGYNGIKVYWNGEIQHFQSLSRRDQLEIIKTSHTSNLTEQDIKYHKKSSSEEFEAFIKGFVGIKEGNLLQFHGIGHHVRTAIIANRASKEYFDNFSEYQKMTPQVLFCALAASLLHDIGRCYGGDMYDIFGSSSAEISGEILKEVGGFSAEEIEWIKEAIKVGGLNKRDVRLSKESVLNEKQLIASLMGDADSYEFERFVDETFCNISYTSIKRLDLHANGGRKTDDILNGLRRVAIDLLNEILEPETSESNIDYKKILRDHLTND